MKELLIIITILTFLLSNEFVAATGHIGFPVVGPVVSVEDNDRILNFTFIYPDEPSFEFVSINYTLYEFVDQGMLQPRVFLSQTINCTVHNTLSCPLSIVPPITFQPGNFVIGCFQWNIWNSNEEHLGTSEECVLGRTSQNFTDLPSIHASHSEPIATAHDLQISGYFPTALPYDSVNISSTLDNEILPTLNHSDTNDTYSFIHSFIYQNLSSNTNYNVCIYFDYTNSAIRGSKTDQIFCQTIFTLKESSSIMIMPNTICIILFLINLLV